MLCRNGYIQKGKQNWIRNKYRRSCRRLFLCVYRFIQTSRTNFTANLILAAILSRVSIWNCRWRLLARSCTLPKIWCISHQFWMHNYVYTHRNLNIEHIVNRASPLFSKRPFQRRYNKMVHHWTEWLLHFKQKNTRMSSFVSIDQSSYSNAETLMANVFFLFLFSPSMFLFILYIFFIVLWCNRRWWGRGQGLWHFTMRSMAKQPGEQMCVRGRRKFIRENGIRRATARVSGWGGLSGRSHHASSRAVFKENYIWK